MRIRKRYIALLRGINVGGNNIVRMTELRRVFENLGFTNVTTYIQSGNVLFDSAKAVSEELVEKLLEKELKKKLSVVIRSQQELETVIAEAPKEFGKEMTKFHYDVLFLKDNLNTKEVIKEIPIKEGVDQVYAGKKVIYFSRLIAKATQSKMTRIVGTTIYKSMTIRNWNTTSKLVAMMNRP